MREAWNQIRSCASSLALEMKWSGKRSAAGSLRAFKGGIEYFHIALLAQVLQPAVEERINLLLEQNLLNARRHFFKDRDCFTGPVLGQQSLLVVAFNLLRGNADSLAESLFNEAQYLYAEAQIAADPSGVSSCAAKKAFHPSSDAQFW